MKISTDYILSISISNFDNYTNNTNLNSIILDKSLFEGTCQILVLEENKYIWFNPEIKFTFNISQNIRSIVHAEG